MPETGVATLRILEKLGHEVHFDPRQTCCGQAPFNAGFPKQAQTMAERFIRLFRDSEVVVGPSGSCVSMVVNHYADLNLPASLRADWESLRRRVHELTAFLVDVLKVEDIGAKFPHRVAIHNSCHALRELGIKSQPYKLLSHVDEINLVESDLRDECCGFGGVFSAKYPSLAREMSDRRASQFGALNPEYVTGVDDSCLLNLGEAFIRNKFPIKTLHISRILASEGKI